MHSSYIPDFPIINLKIIVNLVIKFIPKLKDLPIFLETKRCTKNLKKLCCKAKSDNENVPFVVYLLKSEKIVNIGFFNISGSKWNLVQYRLLNFMSFNRNCNVYGLRNHHAVHSYLGHTVYLKSSYYSLADLCIIIMHASNKYTEIPITGNWRWCAKTTYSNTFNNV